MTNARKKAAPEAVPGIDGVVDTGIDVSENIHKANAEATRQGFENIVHMGREALDAAGKVANEHEGLDKVMAMRKANFEAAVEAGAAFVKGAEGFGNRVFEITRQRAAEAADVRKAMAGARTVQEAIEIQQGYVRKAFDDAVQDGVELSTTWFRLAAEAGQPIQRRFSNALAEAVPPAV